jgi:hypothetical protein
MYHFPCAVAADHRNEEKNHRQGKNCHADNTADVLLTLGGSRLGFQLHLLPTSLFCLRAPFWRRSSPAGRSFLFFPAMTPGILLLYIRHFIYP